VHLHFGLLTCLAQNLPKKGNRKMAKKTVDVEETVSLDDFTSSLIRDLNKERGDTVAFNLSTDDSPTHVKRWISTGIKSLDFICSNRSNGGLPEGRIIEIYGTPSIGKSHVAAQICKSVQKIGGMAVYIDSETATSVENLRALGVNVKSGFVYVNEHCTEHILQIAESTIVKTRALKKEIPVVIVWDSVAASSPKAELEGDYDKETIGLQARAISKGMRKITGIIGDKNVLFVILNQTRTKIGVLHGDPMTTPGGQAIPFHASIRVRLSGGSKVEDKDGNEIGINVIAKTIKNKVVAPHRTVFFQIHFGVGIKEHEELFDVLRDHGPEQHEGLVYHVGGEGAWKYYRVHDPKHPDNLGKEPKFFICDEKFYKTEFGDVLKGAHKKEIDMLLEKAFVKKAAPEVPDVDENSYEEMRSLAIDLNESIGTILPE